MKLISNAVMILRTLMILVKIRENSKDIDRYRAEGNVEAEKANILIAEKTWSQYICKTYGLDINVTGAESVPEDPVVYVSNHQGYSDIIAFMAAIPNRSMGFVAKEELLKVPLYGKWTARVRSIFMPRDNVRGSLRAIDEAIDNLKLGFSMVIFPEGTRSLGGEMAEFKKGSLRLAIKPGVPIIPVTINGSHNAYERQGAMGPAKIDFYIHPPIETKGLSREEANNLSAVVEDIIRKKLEELQSK